MNAPWYIPFPFILINYNLFISGHTYASGIRFMIETLKSYFHFFNLTKTLLTAEKSSYFVALFVILFVKLKQSLNLLVRHLQ